MLRLSVFAGLALVLFSANFADASMRSNDREKQQRYVLCKSKIDPKGLKGAAAKAEYGKCMGDPDHYM